MTESDEEYEEYMRGKKKKKKYQLILYLVLVELMMK